MQDKAKNQYEIEQDNEKIIDELINQISRHTKEMSDIIKLIEKVRDYRAEIYKMQLELKYHLAHIYSEKINQNLEEIKRQVERDAKVRTNESITNWIANISGVMEICNVAQSENVYPATVVIEKIRTLLNAGGDICQTKDDDTNKCVYMFLDRTRSKTLLTTEGFGRNIFYASSKNIKQENKEVTKKSVNEILEKLANGQFSICKNEYDTERAKTMEKIENDCIKSINTIKIAQILQYYEQELLYWQKENLKKLLEIGDNEEYIE